MIEKRYILRKIILLIMLLIFIILIIPTIIVEHCKTKDENIEYDKYLNKRVYFIWEMNNISNSNLYDIWLDSDNDVVYEENIKINVKIDSSIDLSKLKVEINGNKYNVEKNDIELSYKLEERKNNIDIILFNEDEKIKELKKEICYIKPYQEQFNDKNSIVSVSVFYRTINKFEKTKDIEMIKNCGIKNVRANFMQNDVFKNNKYDFSIYDIWINKLLENNINIIALLNNYSVLGEDSIISNDNEIEKYISYADEIIKRYPQINDFEIYNELNMKTQYRGMYDTKEKMYWYNKLLNKLTRKYTNKNIIVAGANNLYEEDRPNRISSLNFYNNLLNRDEDVSVNNFSIHPYNFDKNEVLYRKLDNQKNLENTYGGFDNLYITEYGFPIEKYPEKENSKKIIQETVILSKYSKYANINSFWDMQPEKSKEEHYGLINNEYKPRDIYYSVKNYCENTNGSEYIGQINLADGLEVHVYNKDGKPKIIVWATDSSKPVLINYNGFTASDLYGNQIENKNGKLEITDSPVYLDNVSTNYFYQAISNSITDGYTDFSTKFKDEIANVNGLSNKISNLKQVATNLKNVSSLNENIANNLMKQHFELGNDLINAYNDGSLKIEYVKLSSMLDSLNTIGNSFEDLITVSAKKRITDLTEITNEVNEANSIIENNEKIDIVYPEKIYKFSKDLLDTSSYVLGLEEENDIKTGLINSKAIHAKYLANWSKEFTEIYIKDKLNDPISKILSDNEKAINDEGIKVILNNDISNSYTTLKNNLNGLLNYNDNNLDKLNNVYNSQMEFIKTIVNCYNSKAITIDDNQYKTLIENLVNISDDYKDLYKLYVSEDNLSNKEAEDKINNAINRYNDNTDIDLSKETNFINKLKELYESLSSNDDIALNYLNKQRISKTCEIVSLMLENDIKNVADSECRKITITSDSGLGNYTNHDETITVNLPRKAKVTSDNGASSFIFTENGTKEIKINNRGYDYTYKIVVSNIDKQEPKINTNGGQDVKIDISEDNLKEIKIEKDGKETKAKIGQVISVPGIYKINTTDKAGNSSKKEIIVYKNYTNEQNSQVKYITIKSKTKVKDVRENTNYSITKNSKIIAALKSANSNSNNIDDSYVSTGDVLKDGDNEYTFVVIGDLSGKGQVNASDIIRLRKNIVGITDLSKIQELAADTNLDGKVDILDLVEERKIMVGVK